MAPNHAGTLMGLTNGAANIMSIIAPLLVGFVVHDETDPVQWRYVFFISAGIYFVGNLTFVIFSKTDIQPWNDPEHIENGNAADSVIHISMSLFFVFLF